MPNETGHQILCATTRTDKFSTTFSGRGSGLHWCMTGAARLSKYPWVQTCLHSADLKGKSRSWLAGAERSHNIIPGTPF
jgi:hypothetical protein